MTERGRGNRRKAPSWQDQARSGRTNKASIRSADVSGSVVTYALRLSYYDSHLIELKNIVAFIHCNVVILQGVRGRRFSGGSGNSLGRADLHGLSVADRSNGVG